MAIQLDEATFDEFVQGSDVPVLVDFWAPWCGPCKMMEPIIDDLNAESNGEYSIVKVNVDENPCLAARYGVQGIPAFRLFRDGVVSGTAQGAQPKGLLRTLVKG
jgi:thioredoxin 1